MASKSDLQCACDMIREAVENAGITVEDADSNYNSEFVFTVNGKQYAVCIEESD